MIRFILFLFAVTLSVNSYGANIYSLNYEARTIKVESDDFATMQFMEGQELVLKFKNTNLINAKIVTRQSTTQLTLLVDKIESLQIRDSFEIVSSDSAPKREEKPVGNEGQLDNRFFKSTSNNIYELTERGLIRYLNDELMTTNNELYRDLKLRADINQTRNFVGAVVSLSGMATGVVMMALTGANQTASPENRDDGLALTFGLAGLGVFVASYAVGKVLMTNKKDVIELIELHNSKSREKKLNLVPDESVNTTSDTTRLNYTIGLSDNLTSASFGVRFVF